MERRLIHGSHLENNQIEPHQRLRVDHRLVFAMRYPFLITDFPTVLPMAQIANYKTFQYIAVFPLVLNQ